MRIINAGGFNKTERKQWRAIIFNNLVSAFQTIFAAMQEQETDFEDDDNLVGRFQRSVCGKLTLPALR
jgi:guanine nucleotide-binding protein subunit alpha